MMKIILKKNIKIKKIKIKYEKKNDEEENKNIIKGLIVKRKKKR